MRRNLRNSAALLAYACLLLAQRTAGDQAWDLAAKGDRAGALRLLDKTVHDNPRNADARLLYGSLLSEEGRGKEALLQLTEGVRLRPNSAEAQNALGEASNRFGNPSAARRCFEKAVAIQPNFGIAQLNLGQVLLAATELKPAALHLDSAIALLGATPDAAYARYLRAKVFVEDGDTRSAVAQLETAVTLRPDMAEAWSDLGQARKMLLDDVGALAAFEHAVQVNPSDAIAQYRLGAQYLESDKLEPAIEYLRHASDLNPTDQSILNSLQLALRRAGKPQEAEQVKQRLAALLRNKDKTDQNSLNAIQINNDGAELEKAGNVRAACEKYRQALSLNPDHVGIRVNYAVALLRLGQWAEGLKEMREALRRDPENKTIKAALDDALAQAPPGVAAQ